MNHPPDAPNAPDAADISTLRHSFDGRRLLVGVSGGIAAYKTAFLVSRLAQAGAEVTVAMTDAATRFVGPLTFQALSGRPVYTSPWDHLEASDPQHIALARALAAAVVAPCSANMLAKLAHGRADDAVSLILSAVDRARTPVLLAPAMNSQMWAQPATQRNIATLRDDGFQIIGPADGWQACREVGPGRMTEPADIAAAMAAAVGPPAGGSTVPPRSAKGR